MTYSPFKQTPNFETLLGHRRVSSSKTLFSFNSFNSSINQGLMDSITSNGGTVTHNNTTRSHVLSVTTTTNSRAVFQQHRYNIYQPGRPMRMFTTFTFGTPAANIRKRVGIYDDSDGVFLEQNGTTDVALTVRSSVSGTPIELNRVTQSNWNLDPLNGTGPSGATINWQFDQFLCIDYLWLGIGPIRVSILINDQLIPVHVFYYTNTRTTKHLLSGSLPTRFEITNLGGGASTSFAFDCVGVDSEGGTDDRLILQELRGYSIPGSVKVGSNSFVPVVALRLRTPFDGVANRSLVSLQKFNLFSEDRRFRWEVIRNPTITGGTWSNTSADSLIQYNNSVASYSGGRVIAAGSARERETLSIAEDEGGVILSLSADGNTPDSLLITAQSITGSSDIFSAAQWKEIVR